MSLRRSYGQYWQEMLREGQSEGLIAESMDVKLVQMLLLGALNWSLQWYKPTLYDLEMLAASGISLLLDGLFFADVMAARDQPRASASPTERSQTTPETGYRDPHNSSTADNPSM